LICGNSVKFFAFTNCLVAGVFCSSEGSEIASVAALKLLNFGSKKAADCLINMQFLACFLGFAPERSASVTQTTHFCGTNAQFYVMFGFKLG